MIELFVNGSRRSLRALRMFCTLCVTMLAVAAFAVPAKPGVTRLLTLTDGSTVNATLVGDEYLHYWLGEDGQPYQAVSLQTRRANGTNAVSDNVYQTFDLESAKKSAAKRRNNANQRRARRLAPRKVGNVGSITGDKKGLIILVNFSDVAFQSANNNELYQRIANEVGFSEGKFKGSMYDYFYAQSDGQFRLTFDVVGPYTVSQNCAYYGDNDSNGDDVHPAEMVIEALKLADKDVNYADYDWDDNKTVEQVYVVYAGKGEADGGADYTIWPHEWTLSSAHYFNDGDGPQTLDGVTINTYACGGELNGLYDDGTIAGIGTMCHEFSHCLGYPDFYDTDYSGGQGMGNWDLMCSGSYNDGGYRPAGFTSYERWVAGWKEPTALVNTQTISNMPALQTTGSNSYIIYNKGNNDEYYLLENRQKTGWDASLPGAGLLILHVDYDAEAWSNNQPNDDPSHQRMTWIPADNKYHEGMANDPFPYGPVNSFGKNTTPAATLYNENSDGSYYLDSSITDITQNSDGTISFNFNGIGSPNFSPEGRRFTGTLTVSLSCTTDGATIYYTIDGSEPTTSSNLYSSPLTISETTTVKAIAVKDEERSAVATATYTFVNSLIMADESLSFSAEAGSSETKQLTVLTEGLKEDVTLTLSDDNGVFSLGTTTISKSLEEATVDVTFTPLTAGNYTGTITLSSAGAESVTVSLSATATPVTVPTLNVTDVTATTALASWTACDGVTEYTLQLASDDQFTTGGDSGGSGGFTEDFSGFTAATSYSSTEASQTVDSGTWSYVNVIFQPSAGASDPGSDGMAQIQKSSGYLYLPTVDNPTSISMNVKGSSTGTMTLQQEIAGVWTTIKEFTVSATCATFSHTFTNAGPSVALRLYSSDRALYVYDLSIETSSGSVIAETTVNTNEYSFTGLTPETPYYARVKGDGDWSNVVSFTTAGIAPVWSDFPATTVNVDEIAYITISDYVTGTPAPTIELTSSTANADDYEFEDGYLVFQPSAAGTYTFTFTAENSEGSADATLTITVNPAPVTIPELTISNVTATTAHASWDACDGVSSYTLQLASDDQFSTGGSGADVTLVENDATNTTAPDDWTYNIGNTSGSYLQLFSGHYVITEDFNTSACSDLSLSLSMRTYGGTGQPSITVHYSTDNGVSWSESLGTLYAANSTMAQRTLDISWAAGYPSVRLRIVSTSTSTSVGVGITDIVISGTESAGSGSLIKTETVTGTSYTFTGLSPYTVYYARVKGNADWSDVEDFLTEEAPVTNTAPSWSSTFPATASVNVGQTYTLANVSSYVSGLPAPTITLSAPAGLQAKLEDDTFTFLAESSGDYTFTFTAENSEGSADATLTITVSPAPVTIPELTISNVTDDTALASWTACEGVTEYTIQLASNDQFTTGSPILSEDFSGFSGDGSTDISSSLNDYTATTGWTGFKVYTASEMAKIGASSGQGWIMTPALNASGTLTVVWSAYRYGTSDNNTLLLGISENGTDFVDETITIRDEIATFTNTFTVSGPTVYVRWMASGSSKARFYLDDITISTGGSLIATKTVTGTNYTFDNLEPETTYYARVKGNAGWSNIEEFKTKEVPVDITLADGTDNTSVIEGNDRAYANVTLSGRTLYKDGDWNTLCLPFNVVLAGSPLEGADVRELSNTIETAGVKTGLDDNGVLTLNFTAENGITELVAGTPYIIKWAKAAGYDQANVDTRDIKNPVFSGVTIDATDRKFTSTDGKVEFKGNYNARTFDSENKSILFLGNASTLCYPESNASIGACRAYFEIADASLVRTFNLNFGEESTGIRSLTPGPIPKGEGSIYTLDGRKLDGKPTKKGLYIRNGKVVVIK